MMCYFPDVISQINFKISNFYNCLKLYILATSIKIGISLSKVEIPNCNCLKSKIRAKISFSSSTLWLYDTSITRTSVSDFKFND